MTDSSSIWIFFEPYDALLFRDARPFDAGDVFRARGTWPPSPAPIAGALRRCLLDEAGVDLKAYSDVAAGRASDSNMQSHITTYGGADDFGALKLVGPLVAETDGTSVRPYFPLPYDLTDRRQSLRGFDPASFFGARVSTSDPATMLGWGGEWLGEEQEVMLTLSGIRRYLRVGAVEKEDLQSKALLYVPERRVGIKLSPEGKQVMPGMLYVPEFIRPQDRVEGSNHVRVGLVSEFRAAELRAEVLRLREASVSLGGERQGARLMLFDAEDVLQHDSTPIRMLELADMWRSGGYYTSIAVYLLTPAVFRNGWCPDVVNAEGLFEVNDLTLRLRSAAVSKPITLGRWDLARNQPRASFRAVPAGSVYHFAIERGTFADAVALLHNTTFLQKQANSSLGALGQIGFGWTFVGGRRDGDK